MTNQEIRKEFDFIFSLTDNWDGMGAIMPSNLTFNMCRYIINTLEEKYKNLVTDIYPLPHGTITVDFENSKGEDVSIEFGIELLGICGKIESKDIAIDDIKVDDCISRKETIIEKKLEELWQRN